MFETLRKMIVPIIVIVLLFFVAMIVLEWGLDYTGRQKGTGAKDAGSVNGQTISLVEWQQTYNNVLQQETQNGQQEVSEGRTKEIEQSAWQQLVHETLIMQEAAKHNIVVTDQEVFAYLLLSPPQYMQTVPAFQTDGKFDYEKYKQMMADPKASSFWASIEPSIRTDLLRLKMQEMIVQTAAISEPEVQQAFVDGREKIKVGFVDAPYSKYISRLPIENEQELRQYYDQHKDDYKLQERASLKIAMIEKASTDADWLQTQARLQVIYDSIKAGADFAEMAKEYSDDKSAAEGGDIGWYSSGTMVPEFDRAVFSLKEGEVSEPFKTQFGWHIIKNLGIRADTSATGKSKTTAPQQVHAAHIMLRVAPSQASLDGMYQKLQGFRTAAAENGFDKAAADDSIRVQIPAPFERTGAIQSLGSDAVADSFAFNNPPGTISDVFENNSTYYVLQAGDRLPAGQASFEEVRGRISQDFRLKKVAAICHDTAAAVYNAVRGGGDMKAVATRFGLQYTETDMVSRNDYLPTIGRDPNAIGSAFSMTTVGQTTGPVDHSQGTAVFRLLDRQAADMSQYSEKRDSLFNAVRSAKQQELYARWVRNLIQESKIVSHVDRTSSAGM
jgi:peptidyl-prolyl cis-trans isomerase D